MLELGPLLLKLCKLRLPLLQGAMIAAPGENSVGPGDRVAGERPDHDQRKRRRRRATDQAQTARSTPHDVMKESRSSPERKQKERFGGYSGDKVVDRRSSTEATAVRDHVIQPTRGTRKWMQQSRRARGRRLAVGIGGAFSRITSEIGASFWFSSAFAGSEFSSASSIRRSSATPATPITLLRSSLRSMLLHSVRGCFC